MISVAELDDIRASIAGVRDALDTDLSHGGYDSIAGQIAALRLDRIEGRIAKMLADHDASQMREAGVA